MIEDGTTKTINNIPYVKIECIKIIYEIFNVKMMTEMDIQSFFYLIKKSSEDLGKTMITKVTKFLSLKKIKSKKNSSLFQFVNNLSNIS